MPVPGLDERFITGVDLSPYFVDKDTGAPLAGGKVYFYSDTQRLNGKLVYTLEGTPGAYQYTEMPNPITLSAVGTIQFGGNNVPLYYFPYDANGNVELYYVVVTDAMDVVQYTRQAWPTISGSEIPTNDSGVQTNQISNPQFVEFNDDGSANLTLNFTGTSTDTFEIAPGWMITCSHNGAGSIVVTRNPVAGLTNYSTNPPYTVTITPTGAVTNLLLNQVFYTIPALWSSKYVSAGLLLGAGSSAEVRFYAPNNTYTTLLNASNTGVNPAYYTNTAQIPVSTAPNTGDDGFTILSIVLPISAPCTLSSIQVVSSYEGEVVPYIQESANRQISQTFYAYRDDLLQRPVKSYLVGWDFALNPAQFVGRAVTAAAATARYVWDQTILFQSTASAFTVADSATGSIEVVNSSGSPAQFALVQYLDQTAVRKILTGSSTLSVQVVGKTSATAGVRTTVTLLYTSDVSLPVLPNCVVTSLTATGAVATSSGTWHEIPVDGAKPTTAFLSNSSTPQTINLKGWLPAAVIADADTATYFAIVIGSESVPAGEAVEFQSISLVPGSGATPPAPQTQDEVLRQCQYYYQKSYSPLFYAGEATTSGMVTYPQGWDSGFAATYAAPFEINLSCPMRTVPSITVYAPDGTVNNVSYVRASKSSIGGTNVALTRWQASGSIGYVSSSRIAFMPSGSDFSISGAGVEVTSTVVQFHYIADARLGVV